MAISWADAEQLYQHTQLISENSSSAVWLGECKLNHRPVCIKMVKKGSSTSSRLLTKIIREISLFKKMDHPLVAPLYLWYENVESSCLVMEHLGSGSVLDYVNTKGPVSESLGKRLFTQLVLVLDYLHNDLHIAHRDIKAENIMLDSDHNIRIIDFGLSAEFSEKDPVLFSKCGSPAYVAPEVIMEKGYTKSADIWSAGIVLYALFCGRLPFDSANHGELNHRILNCEPEFPSHINAEVRYIIRRMLNKDPSTRITSVELKDSAFFSRIEAEHINHIKSRFCDTNNITYRTDPHIINLISSYGLDPSSINQCLFLREFDIPTSMYRLIRREQMNHMLSDRSKVFETYPTVQNKNSISKNASISKRPSIEAFLNHNTAKGPRSYNPTASYKDIRTHFRKPQVIE